MSRVEYQKADIKTGNERLLKLAEFLETEVPADHCDFGHILVGESEFLTKEHFIKIAAGEAHGCGAAGCAIGWCPACFPKDFKNTGIRLIGSQPSLTAFESAQLFFSLNPGLPFEEDCYLFEPVCYPNLNSTTKEEVAARIRDFVAKRS